MAIIRLQGKAEKEAGVYYEVDSTSKPIGEGGMGKVYEGKSVNTKTGVTRPVAIKFLFMDLPESAIERARREASIRLRNDNLIEMLGFIETDEDRDGNVVKHYHVVSELLHGVSLSDLIQGKTKGADGKEIPYAQELYLQYQTNPSEFAKTIIKNTLSGIMALHDAGYIHRDIDPSNIFITDDRHIKVIDLGICKQMNALQNEDKQLTVAGTFMGKPEYASPELALGDTKFQNQTTDIYAIGVLLYECMTGKVPFEGTRYDVLDKQVKEKLPLNDIDDKGIRRIIEKATEKRQELRYPSASAMRADLESLDSGGGGLNKRKILMIAAWVGAAVVVGLCIWFMVLNSDREKKYNEEQNRAYIDSLNNVVATNLQKADSLVALAEKRKKNYKSKLQEAKECYAVIEEAQELLKEANVSVTDYSIRVQQLDEAIAQKNQPATESEHHSSRHDNDKSSSSRESSSSKESSSDRESGSSSGTHSLPYGTFKGGWSNGKPHGNGTLTYTSTQTIDSRDSKGRVAQPGEYIIGEWDNGHLVQGRWFKNDGTKEAIIIGKAG